MQPMDKAALHSFMTRCRYGVVSTASSDGTPQSALVGIATTPDLEIVFDTLNSTRKYRNLVERPSCSFVLGWDGEQTVQFEGIAIELNGPELTRCQEVYFAAWPDGQIHLKWPGIAYFVAKPRWIRHSDYDQNPPLIQAFTFPG